MILLLSELFFLRSHYVKYKGFVNYGNLKGNRCRKFLFYYLGDRLVNSYIRYADINDCTVLGIIHSESWKVTYKDIVPDSILDNMSAEKSEKRFYNAFVQGEEENVLILNANQIAGFMCFGKCRDKDLDNSYGEIWGIYLLPQYWGRGLGTELINWGINELHIRGYNKVSLWVLEEISMLVNSMKKWDSPMMEQ